MESDRRRVTLLDQMSAVDDRWSSLQGLTLDAILGYEKNTPPPTGVDQVNRTLIDIFRDEPNYKDADREKKSWKTFREKLKLKRLGVAVAVAGTSSVHIPAPGLPIQNNSNCGSIGTDSLISGQEVNTNEDHVVTDSTSRSLLARLLDDSTNAAAAASSSDSSLRPQIGCNNSIKLTETNTNSNNSIHEDDLAARDRSRCLREVFADSPVLGQEQEAISNEDLMDTNPTSQPLFMLLSTTSNLQPTHPEDSITTLAPGETSSDRNLRPQIPRHSSVKLAETSTDSNNPINEDDLEPGVGSRCLAEVLADERLMSAREAIAAQEAASASASASATAAVEEENEAETELEEEAPLPEPVRMSLMDLLEETDIQMGLAGSMCGGLNNVVEEDGKEVGVQGGGKELMNCCICMIRSKGAAFIPCGHTFCRLCSRELWVQRGNCPLCNGFILEILDIF